MQGCSGVASFEKDLFDLVNGKKVGDRADAAKIDVALADIMAQGYWPVTKAVIAEVRRTMALTTDSRLLLSGFSQGGGRAQLARMYMEKKFSEKPVVITFGAVGAACFPRDLDGPGRTDLLDDVDPTKPYSDVYDYSHILDPWGTAFGSDIGEACYFGTHKIKSTAAYRWCEKIYGYSGSTLVYAEGLAATPWSLQLKDDFFGCRCEYGRWEGGREREM